MVGGIALDQSPFGAIVSDGHVSYLSNAHSDVEGEIRATNYLGNKYVTYAYTTPNEMPKAIVWNSDGSYISSETSMLVRDFSGDGSTVLGIQKQCNEYGYYCATYKGALWNTNTNIKTTIDGMTFPQAFSSDASLIVGNYGGQMQIWDAANGTRNLSQVLTNHGVDLSDWSDTKVLDISEDGTKIVGMGNNEEGVLRAFIINIIPECSNQL